jgi:hypothetical protein
MNHYSVIKARRNTAQVSFLHFQHIIIEQQEFDDEGTVKRKTLNKVNKTTKALGLLCVAGQMAEHSFVLDLFVTFCIKAKSKTELLYILHHLLHHCLTYTSKTKSSIMKEILHGNITAKITE